MPQRFNRPITSFVVLQFVFASMEIWLTEAPSFPNFLSALTTEDSISSYALLFDMHLLNMESLLSKYH
jgi:hypothetical protein